MKHLIVSFFSLACVGALNAANCVWTGGADPADGKWSTKENWQDEAVPQEGDTVKLSGVGLVGGEITNDIANLTIAGLDFSGATPFRLVGEKLNIDGWDSVMKKTATVTVTNACDIACVTTAARFLMVNSGAGSFVLKGKFSGAVRLELQGKSWVVAGANEHTGGIRTSSNANVVLAHTNAIGAAGSTYAASTGSLGFSAAGDYHANFNVCMTEFDLQVAGDYRIYGVVTNTKSGTIRPGRTYNPSGVTSHAGYTHVTLTFEEEYYAPDGELYPLMYEGQTINYKKKVTMKNMTGGNYFNPAAVSCNFFGTNAIPTLGPNRMCRIFCQAADIFPGSLLLFNVDGSSETAGHSQSGIFGLNGFDQTVDRVSDGGLNKMYGTIYTPSGKPATIRLDATKSAYAKAFLSGPLSLTYAATNSSYVQVFSNRVHNLTGAINVECGTLRFDGATALASVPTITVARDGEFRLETTKANALAGLKTLTVADGGAFTVAAGATPLTAGQVDFVLGASATVTLPSGEYEVNTLVIDGGLIEPKTYTGAEIPANFKGVTSLTVKDYPTATWTGAAGDHLWSTAENWLGGIKPENDFYVILSNAGDDGEIVNDMGAMTLSKLTFTGSNPLCLTGDELAFRAAGACIVDTATAAITNAVVMNFPAGSSTVTASGGKAYYITGGLCGAGASVALTQSSGSAYYLGGTGSVDAVSVSGDVNLISDTFLGEGATLTSSGTGVFFYTGGDFRFNLTLTASGPITIRPYVSNAGIRMYGSFDASKLTTTAGQGGLYFLNAQPYQPKSGVTIDFYGPVDLGLKGTLHGNFSGSIRFRNTLRAKWLYGADWGWSAKGPVCFYATNTVAKISPASTLAFVSCAPDVVPGVLVSYEKYTWNTDNAWWDIDGYDQTIDRITADATRINDARPFICSGTSGYSRQGKKASMPATLTLKATDSAMAAVNIRDAITVVLDATNTTYVQTFTNKTCTTTGDLIVKKGVLKIAAGNSFAGVKNVTIGKEGKLVIDTNIASALKSVTNITVLAGGALEVAEGTSMPITAVTPSLTLETGASVTIPSSATYTFNWAEKDGWPLDPATYRTANLPELKAGTIVTTRRKPHSTGLIYFLR